MQTLDIMDNSHLEPTIGALGKKGEPISLAEELALEQSLGIAEPVPDDPFLIGDSAYWQELQQLSIQELIAEARSYGESDLDESLDRQELVLRVIKQRIRQSGLMFFEGSLEILPEEFGFLRSPDNFYRTRPDDIYVSPSQIRRFSIRNGSKVSGPIRPPKTNERYFALLRVEAINHQNPNRQKTQPHFEEMISMPPTQPLSLSPGDFDPNIRDAVTSLTYGSRGLIVGSTESKNTALMQSIAQSLLINDPYTLVFMLFLNKPDDVLHEQQQKLSGRRCEVIGTFPGETIERFIHLTDFMLEKAKRLVEYGKNVLLCVDSFSAFREVSENPSLGCPIRLFRSARKTEKGSLTILATVSDEEESRIYRDGIRISPH